ncbi:hypothetical protein XENOCAPTIV_012432 [Xenoophorus captivus]|uniref:Uncharacterized protein n=1 Tax=Xenoophorus captivus TaxID=1517983 RepID=A0ABV0R004_9TELE
MFKPRRPDCEQHSSLQSKRWETSVSLWTTTLVTDSSGCCRRASLRAAAMAFKRNKTVRTRIGAHLDQDLVELSSVTCIQLAVSVLRTHPPAVLRGLLGLKT